MAKALNVNLSVTADTSQAKAQLQQLQQNLQQLTANSANLQIGLDTSQLQQASAQVTELGIHLKQAINPETGLLNFAKLNTSIKSSGQSLQDYGAALLRLGPQGQQAFTQLASAVAKAEIPTRRLSSVLGNMGTVLKNTIRWQLSSSLIHGFVGSIQQAFGYAKDLNKSLTDIQIVTQASDEHMAKFAEQANKSAKALNTTTTAYTKASLIYYQQGLNDQQVKERTDVTVKMANITGQSAQVVSDQLTAIWNNFAKGGENLEYYADVITALGAATASSSEEISKGLEKFASIADTVGLSYENATAALATITATTRQSADTVGTGLRTLFSRLQSVSLGETLEDGVNLTKYSKALKTIGVDVLDAAGNLREMDDILEDMGAQWNKLTDAQKTATAQTVGGVRQYTTLMALMENFDFYKQNQQVAKNAEGTVQNQADIYAKSWEASQRRVKASAEAIYSDLINDQFFIGLNNGFSNFLNILDNIIDGLGGLKGLLSTIGALSLKLFSKEATQGLVNFSKNLQTIFMSPAQAQAKQTQFLDFAASQMAGLGASEESIQFAKQQIKLQQDYVKNATAMDETSRLTYQTYVDNYERNRLDYLNIEQKIAQSKNNQDIISSNLWSSSANGGYQDAQIKQLKNFVKEYNATLEKGIGNITGDQYQKMQSYLQQGRVQWVNGRLKRSYSQAPFELNRDDFNQALSTQIEEPLKKFPEYEKILQNFTGDVGNLATKLNATDMDKNMIAQITKAYESGGLDGAVKAFHQLNTEQIGANIKGFAEAWGVSAERVQQYVDQVQAAQGDTQKLAEIRRQMDQDIANANRTLGKENSQVQTAKGITQMAQGLMGIASAASALNSIVDTIQRLNDGTMSASEGALALGTSLSTALMMGIMGFNGLTAAAETLNWTIKSGPLIAITLALMALPLAIRGIDALIETQGEKIQRVQKEVEQISNWAQQAQNASQNLLEAQGAHNNLLDEINSLTQGTTEFYNAIIQANSAAQEMISQYGLQFGEDWIYGKNNAIEFTDQGNQKMTDSAKRQSEAAAYVSDIAEQYSASLSKTRDQIAQDYLGLDDKQYRAFKANEGQGYLTQDLVKRGFTNYEDFNNYIDSLYAQSQTVDLTSALAGYASSKNLDLSGIAGESAIEFFNSQVSSEQFKKEFETALNDIGKTGKSLSDEFKETLGFEAIGDLAKDTTTMKNMIASARIMERYGEQFEKNLSQTQQFAKDFGLDNYQNLDYRQLTEYVEAIRNANFAEGSFEKIMTDKVLAEYNRINQATAENIMRAQGKSSEDIEALSDEDAEQITKQLFQDNVSLTKEGLNAALQTVNTIRSAQGKDSKLADTFWNSIFGENGKNFDNQLNSVLANINFGNQLQAAFDLKRYAKLAAKDPELSNQLSNLGDIYIKELGGKAGILEQMWNTEDFQDSLKSLQKQFKKTGKLGSQDILDIADSCDVLADALEFGEISAGALADVISTMGMNGTLSIEMISNALIEALGLANSLEDTWSNATKYFTDIDSGLDSSGQQFADNMNKYSKDMFELLGEGNVGGERLYQEAAVVGNEHYANFMRDFFYNQEKINADNPQLRQQEYEKTFGEWDQVMQTAQQEGNMRAYWDYMINNENASTLFGNSRISGENRENKTISEALQDLGFSTGKEGDIELEVGGKTTTDLIKGLADALNISEEEAGARVAELTSHSQSISTDLRKNDFKAAAASFGQNTIAGQYEWGTWASRGAGGSLTQETHASEAGFESLSIAEQAAFLDANKEIIELLDKEGDAYGRLYKKQLDKLNTQRKEIDYAREQGKSSDDIIAKARSYVQENSNIEDAITKVTDAQTGQTQAIMDAQTRTSDYIAQGLNEQEALEAATQDATEAGAKLGATYTNSMGETVALTMEAGESIEHFNQRLTEAENNAAQQKLGQNIFEGFTQAMSKLETSEVNLPEVNMTIKSNADEVQAEVDAIQKDGDVSVNVTDGGTVATTQGKINSLSGKTITVPVNADTTGFEKQLKAVVEKSYTVNVKVNPTGESPATGGYVIQSHAAGSANRTLSPGLALTAEEGPEIIWNKNNGYSYLVGGNGHPEFVMLRPGDRVFNANQTRQILNYDKPDSNYFNSILDPSNLDQRLFGSFAGGTKDSAYGSYGPNSRYGGASGAANQKEKDYTPERYHVITRQIQDLTFWYEELKKARENAYGTNILDHIDEELKGTEELVKAQEALVKEAEHYREIDLQRMKDLGIDFELDENGNIQNWEELQEKYRKAAEQNKDDTEAKERWDAIQQYEETLDKWQEAYAEFTDLRLQAAELLLERITTKTELKIDFDERDLKLIEHFTKKIDDNIYDTARVLRLAGLSLDKINDKIDTTRQGIDEIFENMTDSKGNQITDMTLEKFLSLSEAERDALDINNDFGKQLEEYSDDLLDYIEELEDFKTKGIDELNTAFNELNDNIQSSMDLFSYYQDTLDNLKNIIDLQGVTISKDLRDVFQTINQTLLSNNANNIQTELVRYEKLSDVVTDLQNKLLTVTDPTLQKEWKNQLKEAEEALRDSQTNLLTLWQDGLDMAKQVFEQNIDNAVREFEEQVAGAYGDLNGLQAAYDRQKEIDNFYVDDYEKYYQISKLQRQINKDLNDAAKNHNKNVKGLNVLFDDLNDAREAGVELTAYDLDIFAKRYAYEKALMDLEDSRNTKQQVRLQRDANGNWGYVYTAVEDDDDLIRKQQAVEDALYEWQKATTAEANRYSDEILPKIRANLEAIAEAYKTGSDIPQNILNETKELLSLWGPQFQKTLEDGAQTLDIAIDRYNNANFDILDNLNETGLAAVLDTGQGIDQLLDILISQMETANNEMNTASINYKNQVDNLNNFFKEYGDSLGTVINAWAQAVGEDSEENKANTSQMIENAKLTFDEILSAANEFEDKFMEKYEPIISRNEQFIIALNEALDALNRKEFVQGQLLPYIGSYIDPSSFASGGFTGAWGSGGRLAVLHEKENVFNAEDTSRLLSASQILRTIDLSISSFAAGFGNILLPNPGPIGNSLDQNVHIEASFPSVTDHNEIELAFDNLINKASQYANRKNMSSMTFQDMYTSKF